MIETYTNKYVVIETYTNKYVVGFAFIGNDVLLIQKAKPQWQAGRFNGVGGKIEVGELPLDAMQREFWEETGIVTSHRQWTPYAQMLFPGEPNEQGRVFEVCHVFTTILIEDQMETFQPNKTEEIVYRKPVELFLKPDPRLMIANIATLLSGAILKRLSPEVNITLTYGK